jgi:hypothetical protein
VPNHEGFAGIRMTGYAGTIAAANNDLAVVGVSPGKVSLRLTRKD